MPQKITVEEFKEVLLGYLLEEATGEKREHILSEGELEKIQRMQKEKYETWEWNYGHSPAFNLKKSQRFANIEFLLDVKKGYIENCKIYGDFFGKEEITELEILLKGQKYEMKTIKDVLKDVKIADYFGTITKDEFMSCLF